MNRQIRRVALAILLMFGVVFINLNWIQLVKAEKLANHPRNTRLLQREYSIERGPILSADGQSLAVSQPTPNEVLKYLRSYPKGPLFADVVGYYSIRFGRTGIERSHNKELTGQGGVITMQDLGDRLGGRSEKGDAVVLSIDSRLQQVAADALNAVGRKGAIVALDPISGQVLAMFSNPSFDPNPVSQHSNAGQQQAFEALAKDPNKPLIAKATAETYFPGSTMKLITASAALESGRGPDTSYPSAKQYLPPQTDKPIKNFGGETCGGNMVQALKISCNTYFAQLGAELPQGAFEKTARAFGFGETPPIDIRAAASRIPTTQQLKSPAFAAQSAIGQFDVSATPLQMALVAAGIANHGRVPVPHLVKEVQDSRGGVVRQTKPETWKTAISDQTAATLRDMMIGVVDGGTGTAAQLAGIKVAGKTGTAQAGPNLDATNAWFVCFAPADSPRIALAVIVEGAGSGNSETGGRLAAPIAKKVLEAYRTIASW